MEEISEDMSDTKKYTLPDLGDLKNVRMAKGEVEYLFHDCQDPDKKRWIPSTSIAPKTRNSRGFNNHIQGCEMVPERYKNHKDLSKYAERNKSKFFGFSLEVYVNEEVSSQIMFPIMYFIRYFAGLRVKDIVRDICQQYQDQFYYLPIRKNGILKKVSDVCFVFFFKYVLNCLQKHVSIVAIYRI